MCAGVPAWAHIAANKTDSLLFVDDVTVTEAPCAAELQNKGCCRDNEPKCTQMDF